MAGTLGVINDTPTIRKNDMNHGDTNNMKYNPDIHHRRSIRLKDYDYSQAGAYFVTICTRDRECYFGNVVDGESKLNQTGKTIMEHWQAIPENFGNIEIDKFVVMPNHIHGIIIINPVGAQFIAPDQYYGNQHQGVMNHAPTVGDVIRAFKARCTYAINKIRKTRGISIWQRNFYERVIRDDVEMGKIRTYIINNPLTWENDENYKG